MKRPIEQRVETIKSLLKGEVNLLKTAELLGCSQRTVRRYRIAFLEHGQEGLLVTRSILKLWEKCFGRLDLNSLSQSRIIR